MRFVGVLAVCFLMRSPLKFCELPLANHRFCAFSALYRKYFFGVVNDEFCTALFKTLSPPESPAYTNAVQLGIDCGLHVHFAVADIKSFGFVGFERLNHFVYGIGIGLCSHVVALSHDNVKKSVEIIARKLLHRAVHLV